MVCWGFSNAVKVSPGSVNITSASIKHPESGVRLQGSLQGWAGYRNQPGRVGSPASLTECFLAFSQLHNSSGKGMSLAGPPLATHCCTFRACPLTTHLQLGPALPWEDSEPPPSSPVRLNLGFLGSHLCTSPRREGLDKHAET